MGRLKLRKYLFSREHLLLYLGLITFITAGFINLKLEKPVIELNKQDTALNINNHVLNFINAGNKRLLTDLLWVQTLIESDTEHYKKRDLNSWLFLRFFTISNLDPLFYENYLYGGQFLAIVKDDLEGAEKIFDKGLVYFPTDYKLNYNAGFLNYYEMGNYPKGIKYLERVVHQPEAPVFLNSIVNKLKVATGVSLEEVFNLVLHNYKTTKDENLRKRLEGDLYAIKAEIDLKCLNNEQANCNNKDFYGDKYIKVDEKYFSPKMFLRYQINKREANSLPSTRINYIK